MARRIAANTLNASTIDIMNVIRQNASYDYQQNVPEVVKACDIPKVGQVIYGTPAFANQFLNALVNRIALVRAQGATFNNPYAQLKKGYLEYGETVESIFVNIAKVVDFSAEKAAGREFKRTIPDVKSAFHVMNYRGMYPVTIQDNDLMQAFTSADGVTNLIAKIVDSIYTAAEYDEFLLFKYLLIKAISSGKIVTQSIGDGTDMDASAEHFRGTSNMLTFMSDKYNEAGVKNTTPKERQIIFMDAMFNARYDVRVLAAAFNMEKADFMGRLHLIDDWTSFDNERFEIIRENSDGLEEVTQAELDLLKNVKAVLIDSEWFQVYDNNNKFTEKYVASGLYWNYFYHTWKTVSHSPFANGVVFVTDNAQIAAPATLTCEITGKDTSEDAIVFTLSADSETATLAPNSVLFDQTEALTKVGIGVIPAGAVLIPAGQKATAITLEADCGGAHYKAATTINAASAVGAKVTMNKQ